jgi:hypothetical protein
MTKRSKREYLQAIARRYHRSGRKAKGIILDEFCEVCGLNRSYAIRVLNQGYKRNKKRPGKISKYADPQFLRILTRIWSGTGWVCGKLLKQALPRWVNLYEECLGAIEEPTRSKLLKISAATIDRQLRGVRAKAGKGKSLIAISKSPER